MIAQATTRRDATRFVVLAAAIAFAVFAADGLTKTMAASALALGDTYDVVPGWLVFTHVRNTGAAYGLLAGYGWLLLPVSVAVAIFVPIVVWRAGLWQAQPVVGGLAAGLIFGGALGNLVERAQSGSVTDFIQVPHIALFQVFNVSDAAICVGAALLLLLSTTRSSSATAPESG